MENYLNIENMNQSLLDAGEKVCGIINGCIRDSDLKITGSKISCVPEAETPHVCVYVSSEGAGILVRIHIFADVLGENPCVASIGSRWFRVETSPDPQNTVDERTFDILFDASEKTYRALAELRNIRDCVKAEFPKSSPISLADLTDTKLTSALTGALTDKGLTSALTDDL